MPLPDPLAAAHTLADTAAWIDDVKFKLPEPLKQEGAEMAEALHDIAQALAGDRVDEVYAPEDKNAKAAQEMTLPISGFVVCSTGEDVAIPEPRNSLAAAIKLRDEKQAGDEDEAWEIVAEVAL